MLAQLRAAVVMLLALTVITGVVYPFLITGIAQAAFPRPANGSLIERGGKVVGSSLIGQPFDDPKYFWGRLSATTDANGKGLPYNGGSSVGSNLGPTNPALTDAAKARIDALHGVDPGAQGPIPVDLVTASGSGLDPHISPAAAEYQVKRVALARHLTEVKLRQLVAQYTQGRGFGVLGEPTVNILKLNLALDGNL